MLVCKCQHNVMVEKNKGGGPSEIIHPKPKMRRLTDPDKYYFQNNIIDSFLCMKVNL